MDPIKKHLRDVKEHPDFPGYYITEEGVIFSLRILNPSQNQDQYGRVTLRKDGKDNQKLVHRLVAETYIPNPDDKPQVNHKDRNKKNNSVSNLEWVTGQENNQHAHARSYLVQNVKTKEVIKVYNMTKWCNEMGLHPSGMFHTLKKIKSHKGWKIVA